MPFLFAVYRVLNVSIDLRGAGFLWIPDLSYQDPLYVTPILMAVSMFLMQRLTPTTMEPAQQRIMMLMPIVLVVFVAAAPAGLNLYWFVSNVCSITQQLVTLKFLESRGDSAPAAAAKRRRR
jgi:YidC/Oxa1 family membrane protein insertase